MKSGKSAVLASAVVVAMAGLATLSPAVSGHGSDLDAAVSRSSAQTGHGRHDDEDRRAMLPPAAGAREPDGHRGHGPPPWAGGPSWAHGDAAKRGKRTGSAWKDLGPRQRADLMAELTRRHADGMERWAKCLAAQRQDCVRPLPPGLAKKRLAKKR